MSQCCCVVVRPLAGSHASQSVACFSFVSEVYRFVRLGWHVTVAVPATESRHLEASLAGQLAAAGISSSSVDFAMVEGEGGARALAAARVASYHAIGQAVAQRAVRIALLGHGTVGGGVFRRLAAEPHRFTVVGCAVRDPNKHNEMVPSGLLSPDADAVAAQEADVLVSLIGGLEPAHSIIANALARGQSVVTANKSVMAAHGPELTSLASNSGADLEYSAAVGGAVPILEAVDRVAKTGQIQRVRGLLSGTANYVLTQVARGEGFDTAVRDAQKHGLAEADPTRDLNGTDTAEKLAVIANRAFGTSISLADIPTRGIDAAAAAPDVGLVATVQRRGDTVVASVEPVTLAADDALVGARGAENRVEIEVLGGTTTVVSGLGAGRWPTTAAVFADIEHIAVQRQWLS